MGWSLSAQEALLERDGDKKTRQVARPYAAVKRKRPQSKLRLAPSPFRVSAPVSTGNESIGCEGFKAF
jgi:hypothetical protein